MIITPNNMSQVQPPVITPAPQFSPEEVMDQTLLFWDCLNDIQFGRINFDKMTKLNTWLYTKDGKWLFQKNRAGWYGVKESDEGITTLPEAPVEDVVIKFKYGKLPQSILDQILGFFRGTMERHSGAEAFCQVYWDLQLEKYVIHVPKQVVSGAHAAYDKTQDLDKIDSDRYIFTYECHSHNSMGAFWSGTDDRDENDLRFFGVFGQLNKETYVNEHRIFIGDTEIKLELSHVFDLEMVEPKYEVTFEDQVEKVILSQISKDEVPRFIVTLDNGDTVEVRKEAIKKAPVAVTVIPEGWHQSVNTPAARAAVKSVLEYMPHTYGGYEKSFKKFGQSANKLKGSVTGRFGSSPVISDPVDDAAEHGDLFLSSSTYEAIDEICDVTSDFGDMGMCEALFRYMESVGMFSPFINSANAYAGGDVSSDSRYLSDTDAYENDRWAQYDLYQQDEMPEGSGRRY